MRRTVFILLAIVSVALAAVPARAQDFMFDSIPWGINRETAHEMMTERGFTYDTEWTPSADEWLYRGDDGAEVFLTFAGVRLVGIRVGYGSTAEGAKDTYARMLAENTDRMGPPDGEEEGQVAWYSGDTGYVLMTGETEVGPYVAVQYLGPGYIQEVERRETVEGGTFPPLDARWFVTSQTEEFRTALDRGSMQTISPGVYRVWVRDDYDPSLREPVIHDQVVYQMEFDCGQQRLRLITARYWRRGERVHTVTPDPATWLLAEPETAEEESLRSTCYYMSSQ